MNRRPNLLLITTDQHRHDYVGYAGGSVVETPNLDAIARRDVAFTHAFTPCPICAPARIALATGRHPLRVAPYANRSALSPSVPTYYQRLCDYGYYTGCVGKLDLAKGYVEPSPHGARPLQYAWGFTHPVETEGKWCGNNDAMGPYKSWLRELGLLEAFRSDYQRRCGTLGQDLFAESAWDSVLPTEAFQDAWIGRRSVRWIEEVPADAPWHLFVSFVGPHEPFDPPTEYADRYRDAAVPEPINPDTSGRPECVTYSPHRMRPTKEQTSAARRQYAAAIAQLDDQVGVILDAVRDRGAWDDTVVVFASDHGEMLGDHGLWGKHVPYEASIRVPLAVAGPGIEVGGRCDALVELHDVAATLLELAGAGPLAEADARSLTPLLHGRAEPDGHRDQIVTMMPWWQCVRDRVSKYVEYAEGAREFFDLAADADELSNLAGGEPDRVRAMGLGLTRRTRELSGPTDARQTLDLYRCPA